MWDVLALLATVYALTALAATLFFLMVRPVRCRICSRCFCKAILFGAAWLPLVIFWMALVFQPKTWHSLHKEDSTCLKK